MFALFSFSLERSREDCRTGTVGQIFLDLLEATFWVVWGVAGGRGGRAWTRCGVDSSLPGICFEWLITSLEDKLFDWLHLRLSCCEICGEDCLAKWIIWELCSGVLSLLVVCRLWKLYKEESYMLLYPDIHNQPPCYKSIIDLLLVTIIVHKIPMIKDTLDKI